MRYHFFNINILLLSLDRKKKLVYLSNDLQHKSPLVQLMEFHIIKYDRFVFHEEIFYIMTSTTELLLGICSYDTERKT